MKPASTVFGRSAGRRASASSALAVCPRTGSDCKLLSPHEKPEQAEKKFKVSDPKSTKEKLYLFDCGSSALGLCG